MTSADQQTESTAMVSFVEHGPAATAGKNTWALFGKSIEKHDGLVYICQISILFVVIIASIVNLSLGRTEMKDLWISLLSSAVGILLPQPKINVQLPRTTN